MMNLDTDTAFKSSGIRKTVGVCIDYDIYGKLLVIAAMKSNFGTKTSVSGLINYAIREFLENNDEFANDMYKRAEQFGIHVEK